MSFTIFSATGCMRCKIVKSYMDDHAMVYEEHDIKAEGKDAFNLFYRENRPNIYRGKDGVEFPILFTGKKIIQGVGEILAFLKAEDRLNEFVKRSDLGCGTFLDILICRLNSWGRNRDSLFLFIAYKIDRLPSSALCSARLLCSTAIAV